MMRTLVWRSKSGPGQMLQAVRRLVSPQVTSAVRSEIVTPSSAAELRILNNCAVAGV